MAALVFDLETIPDAQALRRLGRWGNSSNDAEIIQAALDERQETHGHDFLPLYLHKIVAIACVFRNQNGFQVRALGTADDPEPALISSFFKTIERYTPRLISWNGSGFDLPVLHYRSLIHGVPAPRYWDQGDDDRDFRFNNYLNRYHQRHVDLMDVLAKYNARANAPLDDLARLCGFPGKLDMDGGQVWQAWLAGQQQAIRDYCETDVVNTWLLYCRFRLLRGELDTVAYENELHLVRETLEALEGEHWHAFLEQWSMP